ncbi:MAG: hypothetical protein JSS61_02085 [Verrucomicrobia bacterium]|nr:hypothetical protein [Verrucomicrobiota bacterium]
MSLLPPTFERPFHAILSQSDRNNPCLQANLEALRQYCTQIKHDAETLIALRNENVQLRLSRTIAENGSLESQIQSLSSKNQVLEQTVQALQQALSQSSHEPKTLQQTSQALQEIQAELERTKSSLSALQTSADAERADLESQIESQKAAITALQSQLEALSSKNEQAEQTAGALSQETQAQLDAAKSSLSSYQATNEKLQSQIEELKQQLERYGRADRADQEANLAIETTKTQANETSIKASLILGKTPAPPPPPLPRAKLPLPKPTKSSSRSSSSAASAPSFNEELRRAVTLSAARSVHKPTERQHYWKKLPDVIKRAQFLESELAKQPNNLVFYAELASLRKFTIPSVLKQMDEEISGLIDICDEFLKKLGVGREQPEVLPQGVAEETFNKRELEDFLIQMEPKREEEYDEWGEPIHNGTLLPPLTTGSLVLNFGETVTKSEAVLKFRAKLQQLQRSAEWIVQELEKCSKRD